MGSMNKKYYMKYLSIFFPVLLIVVTGCSSLVEEKEAYIYPFVLYPVEKLRPGTMPDFIDTENIKLAGNEYESALFGIANNQSKDVFIKSLMLHTSGDTQFIEIDVFLVEYVHVNEKSRWFDMPAKRGLWPDPLIPVKHNTVDDPADSQLIEFEKPVIVPSFKNRSFFLEVYYPSHTQSANVNISIGILLSDNQKYNLNLCIDTWNFDLPGESSIATACGFSKNIMIKMHKELSESQFDSEKLYMDYLHLLAKHRVFAQSNISKRIPYKRDKNGIPVFDFSEFDAITGRLLDGNLFPDVPPATSFSFPRPQKGLNSDELFLYYRILSSHLKKNGWFARMFYHLPDEPLSREYSELKQIADKLKAADSGIKILVTEPYTVKLDSYIDMWCVDIPFLGDSVPFTPLFFKGSKPHMDWQYSYPSFIYKSQKRAGKEIWLYTCASAQAFDYPNLFIDSSAQYHRSIPWLMYRYGITGFLYWNLISSYTPGANPRDNQHKAASSIASSNGDGNLLFPGYPELDYINNHIPVPSLRLKILRDGFEDYEYLEMIKKLISSEKADYFCRKILKHSLIWEHDTAKLRDIRHQLGGMIENRFLY